jgi:hypothetical protein
MTDPRSMQESKHDNSGSMQVLVAIIGLAGVIGAAAIGNWNKIFPKASHKITLHGTAESSVFATHAVARTTKAPAREIHSRGQLVVRGTWEYDLDAGIQTQNSSADFRWEQVTDVKRYLAPLHGAEFVVVGIRDFESLTWRDLDSLHYSPKKIDGSNLPTNEIPQGTVVAYKTNEGRLGKLIVDEYGYNLTIRWITYA